MINFLFVLLLSLALVLLLLLLRNNRKQNKLIRRELDSIHQIRASKTELF